MDAHSSDTKSMSISTRNAVIETLIDGDGAALVILPSYGRDSGPDFDEFAKIIAKAGFRVLRPQPRGIGKSVGSMQASLEEMADDIAEVICRLPGGRATVLRRAFFAPGHDARPWLNGWYAETLELQKAAAQAADPKSFRHAGSAPILPIIAESDPFSPYETWRTLREECGDRVTTRIIADASHALFPEQTPSVAKVVLEWLALHPLPS